jgi:formiminoglutamate deiminase
MYRAAGRLDPDRYHSLARALFAELLEAGYTAVGEFHYLHRRPDGAAYAPHGAMAQALAEAARSVGIRLTLLHTAYLRGGLDEHGNPLPGSDAQRPFLDTAREWRDRHEELAAIAGPLVRRGAALHSLRAVDPADLPVLLEATDPDEPLHAHVSEQPAENAQVGEAYGASPVEVLARSGVLSPRFTAVHATHLSPDDVRLLAESDSMVCMCPSTERDLGDGIGPARELADAGVGLAVGSDQHVLVDPFDECRQLEGHERLATGRRSRFDPEELLAAGTLGGYRSLGWQGGEIAVGALADLVVVDPASARTVGTDLARSWLSATAADVRHTVVGGTVVVRDGAHTAGPARDALRAAIEEVWT